MIGDTQASMPPLERAHRHIGMLGVFSCYLTAELCSVVKLLMAHPIQPEPP